MEAVPRLPMISFDLKVSVESTDFAPKLKAYIHDFYHEDPELYSNEIHQLESLRGAAVRPTRDVSGCAILKRYYCQLHFLQSRFPMGKDGPAAVTFTWKDTHSSVVCSLADVRFEMGAILYNIGALHTQLGSNDPRDTPDGMKMACTHFQCAAWTFQQLKDPYPQPPGLELSPDLMEFSYRICLAQAQECILEKSMIDNRKPIIIAKVASAVVKYYHVASSILHHACSDEVNMSETVGSKLFKVWKRYAKFKRVYYTSVCSFFLGQQSEEQQKMGERVAYYNTAHEMLEQAIKIAKNFEKSEINVAAVSESLTFTMDVVEGKRKAAKNENEFIYHEAVPDKDQLEKVFGVSLVKGIAFSVNDAEVSGPDIFARLVPMKAHTVSSLYSEEKAKLVREVGAKIEKADQELVEYMLNLQLDHLYCHKSSELPFPEEIVERCAAMVVKTSDVENLETGLNKLSEMYQDVTNMLKEIDVALQEEETREKEYQLMMGPRPPSIVATDMTREAKKYLEANEKATQSTEKLNVAVKGYIANLRLLSSGLEELAKVIPAPAPVTDPGEEAAIERMQQLKEKVDEMRQQRLMLANQLRESICQDDITRQLVTRQTDNYEALFVEELKKHQQYVSLIEKNLSAQDKILNAVTDAYANYSVVQRKFSRAMQKRSAAIKNLIMSYDSLDEITSKIDKGIKFYSALEANVSKLLSRIRSTCKVQQEEREQILAKNKISLPSKAPPAAAAATAAPRSAPDAPQAPKLKDYLDSMKKDAAATPAMAAYPVATQPDYYPGYVPPAMPDMSAVTANMASLNVTKKYPPWIPGVRPAPVGSESTNTAEGKTAPDASQQPVPPASSSYSYYGAGAAAGAGYSANAGYYSAASGYPAGSYPAGYGAGAGYSGYSQVPQQTYGGYGYSGAQWNYNAQRCSAGDLDVSGIDYPSENSLSAPTAACNGVAPGYGSAPLKTEPAPAAHSPAPAAAPAPAPAPATPAPAPAPAPSPAQPTMQPNFADPNLRYDNGMAYGYGYGTSTAPAPGVTVDNHSAYSQPVSAPKTFPSSDTTAATAAMTEQMAAALAYKHSLGSYDPSRYLATAAPTGYPLPGQSAATSLPGNMGTPITSSFLTQPGSAAAAAAAAAAASMYSATNPGLNPSYTQALAEATKYIQSTVGSCPLPLSSVTAQAGRGSAPTVPSSYAPVPGVPGMVTDYSRVSPFIPASTMTTPTVLSALGTQPSAQPPSSLLSNSPAAAAIANFKNFQSTYPGVSGVSGVPGVPYSSAFQTTQANPLAHTSTAFLTNLAQSTLSGQQPGLLGATQLPYPMTLPSTNPGAFQYPYLNNPASSYYSSAGNFLTNQTSSSHGAAAGAIPDPASGLVPNSMPGYFQSQYGLQYSNAGNGNGSGTNATDYVPSSDNYIYSTSAQNTYMQARMPNSNPSTTYSMNQTSPTAAPANATPASPAAPATPAAPAAAPDQPSNMDLLAGLDFTLTSGQLLAPQNSWGESKGTETTASPVKSSGAQTVAESTSDQGTSTFALAPSGPAAPASAPVAAPVSADAGRRMSTSLAQVAVEQMRMLQVPLEADPAGGHTKPATKDPFQDSEALNQFTQEVEKYEKFVEGLTSKTLNGPTPLDLKWKELLELQEKDVHKRSISVARCYPMKNRFPDILPYDCSRVELPSTKDDYINASYLKDLTPLTPAFILTQSPLPSTYTDFWTMVWEKQVEVIVCLLSDAELNGQVYWPSEKGVEMPMGRMKLSLQTCIVRQHWVERIISVCEPETRATRVVIHLQFTAWPGSSFPPSPGPFLTFVSECLTFHSQQRSPQHPMTVHCLSGVGRTGLFCLLAAAICDIQSGHGLIDLVKLSAAMSERRKNALRDREHLKFAYQSLLYYAQDLLLKHAANKVGACTISRAEDDLGPAPSPGQAPSPATISSPAVSLGVSPSASSLHSSQSSSGRTSPSSHLTDLSQLGQQVRKEKKAPRFTAENFKKSTTGTGTVSIDNQATPDDPFSQLDPLWPLKRT